MKQGATDEEIQNAINRINELGYKEHVIKGWSAP